MKRIVSVAIILATIALMLDMQVVRLPTLHHSTPSIALAQASSPSDYSYQYNDVNIYSNSTLQYLFASLDSDYTYTFTIQFVDAQTGTVSSTYLTKEITGVTSYNWLLSTWPSNTFTPFRIVDNWGNIIGRHFLAPVIPANGWTGASSHASDDAKTAIGTVVYNDANVDGFLHASDTMDAVLTQRGGYTLLHYRTDSASATTDILTIQDIYDNGIAYQIRMGDLANYNKPDSWPSLASIHYHNYIVLNLEGSMPSWVDQIEASGAFDGTYTNPMAIGNATSGVYEYFREYGGGVIGAGESVWIVSPYTYGVTLNAAVDPVDGGKASEQIIYVNIADQEIWNGLENMVGGLVDDYSDTGLPCQLPLTWTAYTPVSHQPISIACDYTTVANSATQSEVIWSVLPSVPYATALADENDYRFNLSVIYSFGTNQPTGIVPIEQRRFRGLVDIPLFLLAAAFLWQVFRFARDHNAPAPVFKVALIAFLIAIVFSNFFDLWMNIILVALIVFLVASLFNSTDTAGVS